MAGGIVLFIGSIALLIGVPELRSERRFASEGVRADARVERKTLRRAGEPGLDSARFEVTCRFTTPAGAAVVGAGSAE